MWGHGFPFGLGCIGGVLAVDGTTVSGVAAEGESVTSIGFRPVGDGSLV